MVDPKIKNRIFEIMYLFISGIIFYILALFFTGDLHEKERRYYEFIKNLIESERFLPEFSEDLLKIWEDYVDS